MKLLVVAGARPNFMKVAPIIRVLRSAGHDTTLVHTGQHFDAELSDAFFRDLSIPSPDFFLGSGSGTHAEQTARIMLAFDPVLTQVRPDWVVVVGDVNSTLACALVAAKRRPELGCRIAHVEAGLRSRDWDMPEEVNRVLTDHLSDLLLTPSVDADANLEREGLPSSKIRMVGNVMIDTLFTELPRARAAACAQRLGLVPRTYVVFTVHRPSNIDSTESISNLVEILRQVASRFAVVFPLHPRTRDALNELSGQLRIRNLHLIKPLCYTDMISFAADAAAVLTDSGGLQEETTALGVPCVTLREQTERPVTITEGTNRLAPWPLTPEGVLSALDEALRPRRSRDLPQGWDGHAATRVVEALQEFGPKPVANH